MCYNSGHSICSLQEIKHWLTYTKDSAINKNKVSFGFSLNTWKSQKKDLMTAASGKFKKRYQADVRRLPRPLGRAVAVPVVLFLTALFLLSHPVFVCAELHNWSRETSAETALCATDNQSDLTAQRVENPEAGSRRQGSESFSVKPELKKEHQSDVVCSLLATHSHSFSSLYAPLYGTSFCNAPFSPRPPPALSLQG